MSTLQNTIFFIEVLPEVDLLKIQDFTKKMFQRSTECPLPPKSTGEMYIYKFRNL